MSSGLLKLIACAAMLFDHAAQVFFPTQLLLRLPGRVTFPIMAYMLAEGVGYTRDPRRYALRILALACCCQPLYGALFYGSWKAPHFSVLFTLLLGLLAILLLRRGEAFSMAGAFALVLSADWLSVDFGSAGVLLIVLCWLFRRQSCGRVLPLAVFCLCLSLSALLAFWNEGGLIGVRANLGFFILTLGPLLALALLWFYNGKRGALTGWFFYAFYPLHLLGLYFVKMHIFA